MQAFLDVLAIGLSFMIATHAFVEGIFLMLTIPIGGLAVALLALEFLVVALVFVLAVLAFDYYIEKFGQDLDECKAVYRN